MSPRMGGYVPADHASRHQDGGRDEISIASLSGTPAALTTHEADLDAHTKDFLEIRRTGQYYGDILGTVTNAALTADRLYVLPFITVRDITIDRIGVEVVAQAGQKIRLGIYNDGTNLYPGTLVADEGEITLSGTGINAIAISPARSLTKGIYWLAIVSDGAPDIRDTNYQNRRILGLGLGSSLDRHNVGWYVAHSYAALPDPFTAGGSLSETTAMPVIALRIASLA